MITLPNKIERDIQGNQTSLIPLIVIAPESDNPIYISTIKGLFDANIFFEDMGLKVSSIKESIDLEKGIFKINNLSLSLNNYQINGQRFSDFVVEQGLLNKTVNIYYKSQTCKTLSDCISIYSGNIKRFTHDDKVCKIQLEDKTEDKLSIEVPIANTGYKSNVYSKDYINKPIPILYGKVDRAPAIPFLSEGQLHHESKISIICDDTLGDNPRVKLGNYFSDSATQSFLDSTTINPLYIYKGDYFQVLETYNLEVIYDPPDDGGRTNWDWIEYDQYIRRDGYLEVSKRYEGLTAKNPPADNELQCVKLRFPNDFISLPNPSSEDVEWYDINNYGVSYEPPAIKSPELSYDNPFLGSSGMSSFSLSSASYQSTFAQVPDNTIDTTDSLDFIIQGFEAYTEPYGLHNTIDDERFKSQYEVMSRLTRYADANNDSNDPRLQFIRLPSGTEILRRMNRLVFKEYAEILYSDVWDDGYDILAYYDENNIEIPLVIYEGGGFQTNPNYDVHHWYEDIYNETQALSDEYSDGDTNIGQMRTRINTSAAFNTAFCQKWMDAQGFTNSNDFDSLGRQGKLWYNDDVSRPYDGSSFNNHQFPFNYLHEDGSIFGKPENIDIQYPNLYIRTELLGTYYWHQNQPGGLPEYIWRSRDWDSIPITYPINGNFITVDSEDKPRYTLGVKYITATLKNGDIADYSDDIVGRCYNLIDLEDGEGGLFSADELPTYTPLTLTYKGRVGTDGRCSTQVYDCDWNGVSIPENEDLTYFNNNDFIYFGGYNAKNWGDGYSSGNGFISESHVLPNYDMGANSGWCIWVKHNISSDEIGGIEPSGHEENLNTTGLRIERNTLIPMANKSKPYSNEEAYLVGHSFNTGTMLGLDPDQITINKPSSTTSRRYGAIFPLKDQEISDDIKTDTFFAGKIKLNFNTSSEGTTQTSDNSLKVVLGAVDVDQSHLPTQNLEIDWGAFDNGLDGTGATLIDATLLECFNNPTTFYNTFDQSVETTNENDGIINYYDSILRINDTFHQVNNYNSLAMIFRLDGNVNIATNIAKFDIEVNSVSLLHYIVFSAALDSSLYVNAEGRVNLSEDINGEGNFKYTNNPANLEIEEDYDLIENPSDIIYHFLEKELNLIDFVDENSINKARNNTIVDKMAFSISDNIKSKNLIEKICQNSNLFPLFKASSLFSLSAIKSTYSSADITINTDDIIKYSFTRTPIEQVYTIVNVKYKKDYAENKYLEETGYVDSYDMFGNKDLGYENGYSYEYLGLDREDKVLEFESDFIRTKGQAESLRNFLLLYNCNQHNVLKLTLPLKYLHLEIGDIVNFSSLINQVKIYGEDYTKTQRRNGQIIYPYFIINSIDKRINQINIEITQLHKLKKEFTPYLGSVTRTFIQNQPFNYTIEDIEQLDDFIMGGQQYYTEEQKRVSDLNLDKYIDENDVVALQNLMNLNSFDGDVNADGVVDVVDIVAIMGQILGETEQTEEILEQFDINEDGTVNIIDVVTLVGQIIGDS